MTDESEAMMRAGCARREAQKLQSGGGYARGGRVAMDRYMNGGMVEETGASLSGAERRAGANGLLRQQTGASVTDAEMRAAERAANGMLRQQTGASVTDAEMSALGAAARMPRRPVR
jgi:hypothetical protein